MSWYMLYNQLPRAEASLDRVIPRLWRAWSPGYDAVEDVAHVRAALPDLAHRRAALRYYGNNLQRGFVAMVTVKPGAPALYLHGAADGCMQAAVGAGAQDLLCPGSRFEIVPGVGHFLHLERPELINSMVAEWLGDPTVRGG
jgi:pimeloyl-ACP methyl ester carboxylesterase